MKFLCIAIIAFAACRPRQHNTPSTEPQDSRISSTEPRDSPRIPSQAATGRGITINGATPDANQMQTLEQLEAASATRLPDGAYWYDPVSGACGAWGAPSAMLIAAGLDLGPPLPANASNGDSGVFINNRELPDAEVRHLANLVGAPLQRGRYFVHANGDAGYEGGPVLLNLQASARRRSNTTGQNGGGGRHISTGSIGNERWFDSDGKGCRMFMTSSGDSISSGC